DPRGEMRLDAIARHLQDVASDDATDGGLDTAFGWVVRRTLVVVRQAPVLAEHIELTTFCTGTGRAWAERRTSIVGEHGGSVEAVSLWVQVDAVNGRPTALGEQFDRIYGEASAGRRVSTRLALPGPPVHAAARPWIVRTVDLDVFGHVNNASHWPAVEAVLVAAGSGRVGVAEMEYLVPIDLESAVELRAAEVEPGCHDIWLTVGGRVHTAGRWRSTLTG
ncbi:MAG: acyl-ACP thioesterase domain-containing protein, partial [Ilumatobacteraceae bacterium]